MKPLTRREKEVYDYICRTIEENGYSPSVRDIRDSLGIKSTSTVHAYINHLEEKGYIHKVITTDLNYHTPELLDRPYYEPAAMGKYLASIMDTLNHDVSVEKVRSTTSKITKLLAKNREEKK